MEFRRQAEIPKESHQAKAEGEEGKRNEGKGGEGEENGARAGNPRKSKERTQ